MDISINGGVLTITDGDSVVDYVLPISPTAKITVKDGYVKFEVSEDDYYRDTIENTTVGAVQVSSEADARTKLRALFPDAGGDTGSTNLENVTSNIVVTDLTKSLVLRADDGTYAKFVITKEGGDFILTLTEVTP